MKKKIYLWVLVLGFSLGNYKILAQSCANYNGNLNQLPVCLPYGDANGNPNWNWELTDINDPTFCSMWYANLSNSTTLVQMGSPFVNPSIIPLQIIAQKQDFTRAKGWELLRLDFGCSRPTAYPHFILYNRYSGLMRVFVFCPLGTETYQSLAIEINPNTNSNYPSTTSFSDTLQTAPDKYLNSNSNSNFGKSYVAIAEPGGLGRWSYAEFTPSFDPNITDSRYDNAMLQLTIYGVTNHQMYASIKGGSQTSNEKVYNFSYNPTQPKTPGPNNSFDFKGVGEKFTRFAAGITTVRTEINTSASNVLTFLDGLGTGDDSLVFGKIKKFFESVKKFTGTSGDFDKTFGKIVQATASINSFFKVFSAVAGLFSESSSSPSAGAMYTSYDLVLQGNINTKVIVQTLALVVPRTLPNSYSNNAPYYNCPLGIFNIANTPEADVVTYKRTDKYTKASTTSLSIPVFRDYVSYKIRNDLKVSFNRDAGLELVSAQAAIVGEVLPNSDGSASYDLFEKQYDPIIPPPFGTTRIINHMRADLESGRLEIKQFDTQKKLHIFQTPYTDISCLNGLAFNAVATTKVYLQVKAILKRANDPSDIPIIFIQNYKLDSYPATISEDMKDHYINHPRNYLPPYANYSQLPEYKSDKILSDYTYNSNKIETADNTLTTNSTLVVSPAVSVTFSAGGTVNLYPGFEARSGSEFTAKINNFGYSLTCNALQYAPFIPAEPCYNTAIQPLWTNNDDQATADDDIAAAQSKLNIFPSITSGIVNITGIDVKQANISVVDQLGREVYRTTKRADNSSLQLNLQPLINGVYFIKISSPGKTITKKVLLSK